MSGSFESVQWNAHVRRLDHGNTLIRMILGGMESESCSLLRKKILSTGG